jgi:D-glycero-alpha-D-manno-heptose-7-phosphate kinase
MHATVINAVAPIRICDIGGWTDTWFARRGCVFNLAVYPYAEVQVHVHQRDTRDDQVVIHAENFGVSYAVDDLVGAYDKLPLVEAAIRRMTIPDDYAIEIEIYCQVPPGASTGTSAAVSVAIIGALDRLTPGTLTPYETARLAHAIETEDLRLQSGVQDQICSAYGGINLIQIGEFPHASVSPVQIPDTLWWELERRMSLVYVGQPHHSSAIHKQVIAGLGDHAETDPRLERLRQLAVEAKDALCAGDWMHFGTILDANTQVQRDLHPSLVGGDFERVMTIARDHNALGCKVNGAGGDGGSVSVLCGGSSSRRRVMLAALAEKGFTVVPVYLARHGLRVWTS